MLALRDRVQCGAAPAALGSFRHATSAAAQPDPHAPRIRRNRGSAVDVALQADHLGDTRGDRVLGVHSHLLSERIIWIGTAIDAGVANAVIGQRLFLGSDSPDSDVQLSLDYDGGDPSVMIAISDTTRFSHPAITTTCVGQAIGVGAVLLAARAEEKRSALPHPRVVLADEAVRTRAENEDVLTVDSGQRVDRLRADTDQDRVLTARQAQQYGLADHVITRRSRTALTADASRCEEEPALPLFATSTCGASPLAELFCCRRVPSPTSTAATPLRDDRRRAECPCGHWDERGALDRRLHA